MPPVLSSKDVVKALEKMGFVEAAQKGSHKKLKHSLREFSSWTPRLNAQMDALMLS